MKISSLQPRQEVAEIRLYASSSTTEVLQNKWRVVTQNQITKTNKQCAQSEARPSTAICWLHTLNTIGSRPFASPHLMVLCVQSYQDADDGDTVGLLNVGQCKQPETTDTPRRYHCIFSPRNLQDIHKTLQRVTQICNFSNTQVTIFNIVICILISFCN